MSRKLLLLSAAAILAAGTAWAQDDDLAPKLSFTATDTSTITATVEELNYETREATLRGPEGNTVSFVVADAVQRLDEVEVGDNVTVDYDQVFTLDVFDNDGAEPDVAELAALGRRAEDEAPGGAVADTLVITAVVTAINLEEQTATLQLADGSLRTIHAENPENLEKASVGDLVVMTSTEVVAVSVTPG
jgi:hypothetical protein